MSPVSLVFILHNTNKPCGAVLQDLVRIARPSQHFFFSAVLYYTVFNLCKIGLLKFENFPKNEASDVYSFGMLMYELLFPSIGHPWESVSKSSNPQVVSASIMQAVKCGRRPPVEDSLSNDHFIVTMKKCWDEDPKIDH